MAMRRIFWGFCRNWFLMSTLHYLSSRSDFGFEFAEIFVFEKWLPAITDTGSRRLRISVIRGSPTPRITDTRSRQLSVLMIRRVVNSTHQWYGESPTPRIVESESRWLCVSPIRRVDFGIWISPRIQSKNRNGLKGSVRNLGQSDLCKNIGKTGSLPCPSFSE